VLQLRCGGILNNRFIANCIESVPVKNEHWLILGNDMDSIKCDNF